jgi:predicted nucleic acid-binding protein
MDFIDTNVIVYANDRRDPRKQDIALNVISTAMRQRSGVISVQVLQEYANTALAKLRQQSATVLRQLALLESLSIVSPDAKMVRRSAELQALFQISFWDASILAAAETAGCRRVLSEDLTDGGINGSLRVCNPFAESSR